MCRTAAAGCAGPENSRNFAVHSDQVEARRSTHRSTRRSTGHASTGVGCGSRCQCGTPNTCSYQDRSLPTTGASSNNGYRGERRVPRAGAGWVAPGDKDWLAQVAGELRRLQRRLGPDFESLSEAGQRAVGDVARAAVPAWRRLTRGEPRWPVSVAVLIMIVLQLRLPGDLTPIGRWLLPVMELVVLAVLVVANPRRIDRGSPVLRGLGLGLIAVASLANAWSVALLIDDLLHGNNGDDPVPLLATGANIWITNVIIFALWYWAVS